MQFTFKWFEAQVEYLLPDDEVKERYRLLGHCFQGQAETKWAAIVAKVLPEDRTLATLREAKMEYLEAVANIKNLGDCVIRQLRDRMKPALMPFDDYIDRRQAWLNYVLDTKSLLRTTISKPTNQELAE